MDEFTELLRGSVTLLGVLISVSISFLIAIFGDDIRAWLRPPKLRITLPDLKGEWTVLRNKEKKITDEAIYFHAVIDNEKPSRIAHDCELFLIECFVKYEGQDRQEQLLPCALPVQARRRFNGKRHDRVNIGVAPFAYDLCRCLRSGRVEILLNCGYPNNFEPWLEKAGNLDFTIEARATNGRSDKVKILLSWDGIYPEKSEGLGGHIRIKYQCFG